MSKRNALIFGAGNIGRGFLGLELNRAGYDLTFVDGLQNSLDALNRSKGYNVEIAETGEIKFVPIRKAISTSNEKEIGKAIEQATIVATAVGPDNLGDVGRVLQKPLIERTKNQRFLNVISCENMIGNSRALKTHIGKNLTRVEKDKLATFIGFPSSVVDRISIPSIGLTRVEQKFEWIAQGDYWKAFTPPTCIEFVEEIDPFLKRKLYVLNGAHSIIGFMSGNTKYVNDAMQNPLLRKTVIGHIEEASAGLSAKYEFTSKELGDYQEVILSRFDNSLVKDLTSRLVRGQIRKIGREERLVGPALMAIEAGIEPINTARGIAYLLRYHNEKDQESSELHTSLSSRGLAKTLQDYSNLNQDNDNDRKLINLIEQNLK